MCMCYGLTTDILTTKNLLSKRDSISNQICVYYVHSLLLAF